MEVTRRYWGDAGLAVVLVGLAVVFGRPLLLVGAAGVGGWLLARQYAFVRDAANVNANVSVVQTFERDAVAVDDELEVSLAVELPHPTPVWLEVEAEPPPGVSVSSEVDTDEDAAGERVTDGSEAAPRVVLAPGEETATTTFGVHCSLAGAFEFGSAAVTTTDGTGRFRTAFDAGEGPTLTVDPNSQRNLHVGIGGEARDLTFGSHDSDERGPGIDLAEIRKYVAGDAVHNIDWNATARLNEPHVREYEVDTQRGTAVLLDRRTSMADGTDGETKFDCVRQLALAIVNYARQRNEPLAVYEVGDEGLLARHRPTAAEDGYVRIERRLRALEPQRVGTEGTNPQGGDRERERSVQSPADARRRTHRLRGDDSAFADRLSPFFEDIDPYVERIQNDPLYKVARTYLGRLRGTFTTVVLTDDANRTETREVAKVANRHDGHVLTFLTPSVLFEREGPGDPEVAYNRYVDFERFRREIAAIDGASAFEVGPGDRLDALLATNETRRRVEAGD